MHAPRHPLELLARNLELRAELSGEDRAAVLGLSHTRRTLNAGAYILREGEALASCAVLVSGFAYRHKLTGEGARQIVAVNMPGDALDFEGLFLDVADHSIQMLTDGEVAYVPRAEIQALARDLPGVGHAILVKILVEGSIFREWVLNVGRRNSRTRVAHLLCEIAVRLRAKGLAAEYGYDLPMTQEQLADAVGLTAVHVNRTLKGMESDGLITRSRRNIAFPDWEKMRRIGDFNQRYLHLDRQEGGKQAA